MCTAVCVARPGYSAGILVAREIANEQGLVEGWDRWRERRGDGGKGAGRRVNPTRELTGSSLLRQTWDLKDPQFLIEFQGRKDHLNKAKFKPYCTTVLHTRKQVRVMLGGSPRLALYLVVPRQGSCEGHRHRRSSEAVFLAVSGPSSEVLVIRLFEWILVSLELPV